MDKVTFQWFRFLDYKLNLLLSYAVSDKAARAALISRINAKAAELKSAVAAGLDQDPFHLFPQEVPMPTGVQPIDDLVTVVAALDTVIDSATATLNGVAQRIADVTAAVLANGATAAQLVPLVDLKNDLIAKSQALAAAIVAGTPSAPTP